MSYPPLYLRAMKFKNLSFLRANPTSGIPWIDFTFRQRIAIAIVMTWGIHFVAGLGSQLRHSAFEIAPSFPLCSRLFPPVHAISRYFTLFARGGEGGACSSP